MALRVVKLPWPGAALLALAFLIAAAPARAELAFRDTAPRTVSHKQLIDRVPFVLCNAGEAPARRLSVRYLRFRLKQDGKAIPAFRALAPADLPTRIGTGQCKRFSISLRPGATLDAGRYPGLLLVSSSAGFARREVSVSRRAKQSPKGATTAVGALNPVALAANRDGPFRGVEMANGGYLFLRAPADGAEVKLNGNRMLGSVYRGTDRARIYRAGEQERVDDMVQLPVRVEGIDGTGEFTGTLDVSGTGDPAKGVPVKLEVTDDAEWAILAVLLGTLAAWLGQLWVRRWRIQVRLWRRRRSLRRRYSEAADEAAAARAAAARPDLPVLNAPSNAKIISYIRKLEQSTAGYAGGVVYFDTSSEPFKELLASYGQVDRDIACLRGDAEGGVVARLCELIEELDGVIECALDLYGEEVPDVVRRGAAILQCDIQEVGGALALSKRAREHRDYAREWRELAKRAWRYDRWWRALASRIAHLPAADDGRKAFFGIGAALREIEHELFAAEDAAASKQATVAADVQEVYEELARLGARHGCWIPADDRPTPRIPKAIRDDLASDAQPGLASLTSAQAYSLKSVTEDEPAATLESAEPAGIVGRITQLGDWVVVGFSLLVGILTALAAVYFGKLFGDTASYVAAFLAGAGSQLLIGTLAETVGKMREVDALRFAVYAPKAARVVT